MAPHADRNRRYPSTHEEHEIATASKTSPPRRRLRPEDRREEILASATDLISTVGFNATTLDHFAQAAGISRPGLLHHFSSKELLLEAVLARRDGDTIAAVLRDGVTVAESPAEAREVITALVRFNAARPKLVQLYTILAAEALAPEHPAYDYFNRRQTVARDLFAEEVLAWHPDPPAAAVQLIAYLDGLQLFWLRDPRTDMVAQWELFADAFFSAT